MIRLIGYFFGIGTVLFLIVAAGIAWYIGDVSKDLPDYEVLNSYEPPVTTRVHASSGELMAEYARERRLFLPIQAIPDRVKAAFLSAEDKNFYHHPGVDPVGLARAVVNNIRTGGRRLVGASTITQQVAKNFLLTNRPDLSSARSRKPCSPSASSRPIRRTGFSSFISTRSSSAWFLRHRRGCADLFQQVGQRAEPSQKAAYLAALPKAPNNYHPFRDTERGGRTPQLGDRPHGRERLCPGRRRADAKAQPLGVNFRAFRLLPVRLGILHRGSPRN
jgi:penicillin-binding protein 1A